MLAVILMRTPMASGLVWGSSGYVKHTQTTIVLFKNKGSPDPAKVIKMIENSSQRTLECIPKPLKVWPGPEKNTYENTLEKKMKTHTEKERR